MNFERGRFLGNTVIFLGYIPWADGWMGWIGKKAGTRQGILSGFDRLYSFFIFSLSWFLLLDLIMEYDISPFRFS